VARVQLKQPCWIATLENKTDLNATTRNESWLRRGCLRNPELRLYQGKGLWAFIAPSGKKFKCWLARVEVAAVIVKRPSGAQKNNGATILASGRDVLL
jgi:hypothetical protein